VYAEAGTGAALTATGAGFACLSSSLSWQVDRGRAGAARAEGQSSKRTRVLSGRRDVDALGDVGAEDDAVDAALARAAPSPERTANPIRSNPRTGPCRCRRGETHA
jgi:hypothetical protein